MFFLVSYVNNFFTPLQRCNQVALSLPALEAKVSLTFFKRKKKIAEDVLSAFL